MHGFTRGSFVNGDKKLCTKCKKELPLSDFRENLKNWRDNFLNHSCILCEKETRNSEKSKEKQKEYYLNSKTEIGRKVKNVKNKQRRSKITSNNLTKGREDYIKNKYDLSIEEYFELLEKQDNKCAICGNPEKRRNKLGSTAPLSIDHHHESGRIRGLLCNNCNVALGMFKDDIVLLKSAIIYLNNS